MRRLVVGVVAAAVLVSMGRIALAQSKTVKAEMRVETATVEAIEASSRTITLKKPDGTFVTTVAGPEVTRFAENLESMEIRYKILPARYAFVRNLVLLSAAGENRFFSLKLISFPLPFF